VIPGDVTEAAVAQCEATMKSKADTSPEAMQRMVAAFEPFGVTREQIEKRIQRRLDAIQPAQVVSLKKIYASLRDGMSAPIDWFGIESAEEATTTPATSTRTDAVKDKLRAKKDAKVATAQGQALRDHETRPAPLVIYTQVAEQLSKAADQDLLDAAADLIREIEDEAQRTELSAIYDQRRKVMSQ
jgi:hypothetical protein